METTSSTNTDRRTVVGVFDGPNHAEMALNDLKEAGFSPDQVSVVAKDNRETREMVENTGMGAEGATAGAFLGGITGGILGWLVGVGALAIPGVGPVVAAGALATTLGGAALGAVAGGIVGALVDAGVPEEDARGYEEHVRQGSILLTVHATTDQQARQAHRIFERHGGADVRGYGYDTSRRNDDDDDSAAGEMTVGSVVGGSAGAIGGGLVGGPPGAVAGGLIGGSAGAAAGGAAH
ncbi:MAG: general stress protein, partial [Chloroflexota bacterium]|nr:general stress protein [Chloroflexota bacterium]